MEIFNSDLLPASFFILALLAGFYMAWNIGANDVANAMGTSVGSHAITLTTAVLIAAVFEFSGAYLVGGNVTATVRKGIIETEYFQTPETINHLLFGMLAALLSAGTWLLLATKKGWPVSTTHSIVGAIVGIGLITGGTDIIQWMKLGEISASWITSPLMSGTIAFFTFTAIRRYILDRTSPIQAVKKNGIYILFFSFFVMLAILMVKGFKHVAFISSMTFGTKLLLSAIISIVIALGFNFFIQRFIKKAEQRINSSNELDISLEFKVVEKVFAIIQVISASFVAFAHGANDVANAIGPLATIIAIGQDGISALSSKSVVSPWLLAGGGVAIVIGLATWGYKVIEMVGKKITELTPTRGFAAEISAALTIVVASLIGMPISTTHTLVGAVMGVGLARGMASLNKRVIRDILASWVITIPAGIILAIIFYYILNGLFT